MIKLPPLPALRAFEAVSRLDSVVRAAEELHVTHGAVSQQLRALEEFLGFALIRRNGRRLTITEDGRLYAWRLRAALNDIINATADVLALPRSDELVVALTPSFGAHWLVRRLPSFCVANPDLKVTLRAGLNFVDFNVDRVDAAIRIGPGGWEGVSHLRLFDDDLVVVAAARFNKGKLPRTPAAIMRAPLVRSVESWSPWLVAAGLPDTPLAGPIYTDSNLVIEAVRQGQGITLTRRSLAHDLLRSGELVQLSDIVVPYNTPYWLIWPVRSEGTAKLTAFANWLTDQVRAYRAGLG
jgi:LysR family transcriptional regulator, glycine cleavage system transcriptional activator